jgi:hypothetical protein
MTEQALAYSALDPSCSAEGLGHALYSGDGAVSSLRLFRALMQHGAGAGQKHHRPASRPD